MDSNYIIIFNASRPLQIPIRPIWLIIIFHALRIPAVYLRRITGMELLPSTEKQGRMRQPGILVDSPQNSIVPKIETATRIDFKSKG
jgi:hypothetical protein